MTTRTILSAFLLAIALPTFAQESSQADANTASSASSKPVYTRDISLFAQGGGPLKEGDGSVSVQGAFYRWQKHSSSQTFYKLGAGVGSAFNVPSRRTVPVSADSAFNVEVWNPQRVALLLGGVETQRHLRKNVYLTAALEVQAGGTDGRLDSVARRIPSESGSPINGDLIGLPVRLADTRRYFGAGLAMLGVRTYVGRITAAVDLFTGLQMSARMEKRATSDYTVFDFGLGRSGARFSVGYRF